MFDKMKYEQKWMMSVNIFIEKLTMAQVISPKKRMFPPKIYSNMSGSDVFEISVISSKTAKDNRFYCFNKDNFST